MPLPFSIPPSKRTQLQHAESSRRYAAKRAEGFAFLLATQPPTQDELNELRRKRPNLWNGFPNQDKP